MMPELEYPPRSDKIRAREIGCAYMLGIAVGISFAAVTVVLIFILVNYA